MKAKTRGMKEAIIAAVLAGAVLPAFAERFSLGVAVAGGRGAFAFGYQSGVPAVCPAPVVCAPPVRPAPVVCAPRVVYAPAPVVCAPRPVFLRPAPAVCAPPVRTVTVRGGYWLERETRVWVEGYWVEGLDAFGRRSQSWQPGRWEIRRTREWVPG